jgi:cytosine/adenosine deaminase-related metal-dependent hydrolase
MIGRSVALFFVSSIVLASFACGGGDDDPQPSGGAGGTGATGGEGGTGADGPDFIVEVCEGAPTASPGAAVCEVQSGDARILVVGDVLTPGTVYEAGAVLLDQGGAIACVGCDCFAEAAGATAVVCPDAVVSAGLINAHDHVGWMNGRPWVADENNVDPALRWEHRHDWRTGARNHPEIDVDGGGANNDEKAFGELRFALSGATAIFGSGDLSGILRDLDNTGDGDNGLSQPGAKYDTFPLGDNSGAQEEMGCGAYDVTDAAAGFYDSHAPHVAEGIDQVARNEFYCLTGQASGGKAVLDQRSAIIHGVGLTPDEIAVMSADAMRLIWSPRSNIALYGDTAPVTVYDHLGVSIGLGTDWVPSGSMNMLRELACAASFNDNNLGGHFSDHALWQMATVGSARALAFDDVTGQLAAGYAGDVAVFAKNGRDNYSAVVDAELADVALVLRGGLVLNGNAPVVSALEQGCDNIDVCGVSKAVCTQRDTGKSLSQIQAAGGGSYALFFCGAPDDEPSCLPARTLQNDAVNGSTIYSGMSSMDDPDGDGLADANDNCPTVFNPIRPVDEGAQGDADSDGLGDACDVCVFDPSDSCAGAGDDADGDGVLNDVDNCPGIANGGQEDVDMDDKGDACDPCPDVPNPGALTCPGETTTIYAVQDTSDPNHPAEGTRVRVPCIVTAIGQDLTWCQDEGGGPFSGIAVFVAGTPTYPTMDPVALGDRVFVDGDYTEFFDVSELDNPEFTLVSAGAVPSPAVVTASTIANGGAMAEQYEGVFVQVQNVTVTTVNADAPNDDFDEFEVDGLRIDDLLVDGGGMGGMLDNTFMIGTTFTTIAGVHHYGFGNFKLLPRTLADITP